VQRFRCGLVFKAHRLVYQSTLGLRVIKKKKAWRGSEEGSYLRLIDSLNSRLESNKEEEGLAWHLAELLLDHGLER